MADLVAKAPPRRINSQQLAWGVMLVSFAVFCVIAVFVVLGLHYFVFQSRVSMQSAVRVARGTPTLVGTDLIETAVTKPGFIFNNSVLTTDTQSQASISFTDPQQDNTLIAVVTLENGSSLFLKQGTRPRFDWSVDSYWIDFEDAYGAIDVFIPENLGRSILISFETTLGPSLHLGASGRYTLIAANGQVQVINYTGEAVLIAPDLRTQSVPAGQTASIQENTDEFTLAQHPDLLGDAGFTESNILDINATSDEVDAQAWLCNSMQDPDQPVGSFGLTTVDGRPVLRLFRGDNAESHGVTLCWHGLGTGTGGLDVSQANSVSIRATFKIVSQSLSACGTEGSECPLTLAMDYIPVNRGDPVKWYHGFYAFVDPSRVFPLRCESCSEQHEQINPDVWYTYESHNLFETFALQDKPQSILNLRFYASGHQYEVYVNQVVLLVDQAEIPLVNADS